MCGIGGILELTHRPWPVLRSALSHMNEVQKHRGPDGEGLWLHPKGHVGLAHRRLSIIDLDSGQQPMTDGHGNWISYNGEIYNYMELREEIGSSVFSTKSDTEVILHGYRKWGPDVVQHLRGMFAFALWDDTRGALFCARDRFGIKPFYYTIVDQRFYFASEAKALLPFLPSVETDVEGFKDYLTFQFCLGGKTLFKDIHELPPAHTLSVSSGTISPQRYWQVYYTPEFGQSTSYFEQRIQELMKDSITLHLRSDVPVGAYVSGGIDSTIIAAMAVREQPSGFEGFTGRFSFNEAYDESQYARLAAQNAGIALHEIDITEDDFVENIEKVIYHLDFPVAGPGAFAQYMVSRLASSCRKVVLGGQGGDEIFGGYVRYLIAYFEQCVKAAIDGTMRSGNFVVTYESILGNLAALRNYKPLMREFWAEGLFDDLDKRYFRLVNHSRDLKDEIYWDRLGTYSPYETFNSIFSSSNVGKLSYFDRMTHFDFKTLLPALLQVEDRMSMAHGMESRVPFVDHPLVELTATIPADVKFKNGTLKHVLKTALGEYLPNAIAERTDKMGFPVPLTEWIASRGRVREFIYDLFSSDHAAHREFINHHAVLKSLDEGRPFSRKVWGLLCLELWYKQFHDRSHAFQHSFQASR